MAETPSPNPAANWPNTADPTIGPVRSGLMPRKVVFPFKLPPFAADMRRQCDRHCVHALQRTKVTVRVRRKTEMIAGGKGVFESFALPTSGGI